MIRTLPSSIASDKEIKAIAQIITDKLKSLSEQQYTLLFLHNIDDVPAKILDLLAQEYHVDFYNTSYDISQKRELVKTAIEVHRYKGTAYAVKTAVASVFGSALTKEWQEYNGEPYKFRVDVRLDAVTSEDLLVALGSAISRSKNTRSWLEYLNAIIDNTSGVINYGTFATINKKIEINIANNAFDVSGDIAIGSTVDIYAVNYIKEA